jgi:hypothetical protein
VLCYLKSNLADRRPLIISGLLMHSSHLLEKDMLMFKLQFAEYCVVRNVEDMLKARGELVRKSTDEGDTFEFSANDTSDSTNKQ